MPSLIINNLRAVTGVFRISVTVLDVSVHDHYYVLVLNKLRKAFQMSFLSCHAMLCTVVRKAR